jgi:hypothetical protein
VPLYFHDDGSVDVDGTYKRTQYDNGSAAGSPPDFDGSAYGEKPAPYVEPSRLLPRLGTMPILIAGGITPNAPKADEGAQVVPGATKVAPMPVSGPGQPVLRASADTPAPATVATRVDWRFVVAGSLALVVLFFLFGDRDE